MSEQDTVSVRVLIEGQVQRVGFRYWVIDRASALGLHGWVRNRTDGSVEALFSGPEAAVEEMIGHCKRGPGAARVDAVARFPDEPPDEHGFHYLPTARTVR